MPEADPSPLVPLDELETFCDGLDHAEGITVTPDGTIYVGGEAGQIYRVEPDGTPTQVHSTGGFLLGLAADGDGNLYAIDSAGPCVWRIDPATGAQERFFDGTRDRPGRVLNWGAFDAHGNYYVSDSGGWGACDGVIYVRRAGGEAAVWTTESANFPNGMAVAADSRTLYVVESYPSAIVRYAIGDDGRCGARQVLCDLGLAVPDGVAITADGGLVVSCYRPDTVYRWTDASGLQVLAADPRGTVLAAPTNVVFTGPDLDEMVVPNLGRWHLTRIRAGLRGVPLHYPLRNRIDGGAGAPA